MKNNFILKFLASFPIILIMLYFIPFLGICLLLLRYYMYKDKSKNLIEIYLILMGLIILIPKGIDSISKITKVNADSIPYLSNIISSDLYNINFINYSKRLITIGIIFLILSFVLKTSMEKLEIKLKEYVKEKQQRNDEITKQNDMEIKLKQERAKNTGYVKCPTCGSDNILSEKYGVCNHCRSTLVNKNYHE